MIISMLEFTKKGLENSDTDIIQSMSGKIQTISALHKHLYVDVHNEFVDMNTYYREIVKHYEDIGLRYSFDISIAPTQVRSERIVYFGLILNEMLSNTLEHGNAEQKEIILHVTSENDQLLFEYCDHSVHPLDKPEGTGTRLIQQLVRRIKGIDYQMDRASGTYRFHFLADK